MNLYEEIGLMVVGSRMKKISHRLQQDILKIYESEGIRFELSWYPVFYLLEKEGSVPVTEMANRLDMSHPSVIQTVNSLRKEKLVETVSDTNDKRKQPVRLSAKGKQLAMQLKPVWERMQAAVNAFLADSPISNQLQEVLRELELNYEKKSIYERYNDLT